ncbi:MAG: Gfo/Idh/MocA family oxidoreductase [Tannerellaceae bacterium]|jgi:predicted dehydrogenase|nr:Gfo/Idh/MocA family oxidoreductase [Tannerellaceae bacterium]
MNPIRFAVVGCGRIGKRHAEMISRNGAAKLTALCDLRSQVETGMEDYDAPWFSDINTMLQSDIDIDVVNICTPNGLHAAMAVSSIESGRHVVVEKPLALTQADAEAVVHASLCHRRHVFCVMQNRYSPPSVWIKSMVESGRLGDIYMVQLNCYWNRDERYYLPGGWHGNAALDGGTLFTQFSHFIDIMYWLFGDITDIAARFADFNHRHLTDFEDSGIVNFRFIKGGIGSLCYSTAVWDRNLESSLLVTAQNGSLKIGGQYMDKVEYCHINNYTLPNLPPTNPGNDYGAYKGSAQNHHYVINNVVNVLSGPGCEAITTNVLEGMKVVDIIRRIYDLKIEN